MRIASLVALGLVACAGAPVRPELPLPADLALASDDAAITPDYLFALQGGQLYFKLNPQEGPSDWARLGDGLPDALSPWFIRPRALRRIWADGQYLVAEGDDGVFYSLRWGTAFVTGWGTLLRFGRGGFAWSRSWGFPLVPFQPPLTQNVPARALAFSSRTTFNVGYYADPNGFPHSLDFGCDTLFALSPDGSRISFADPWLPGGFGHGKELTGPDRGRLRGVSLAAAASTLMLLAEDGRVYTRMFDFDIAGEDFYFFSYTWADRDSGYLRVRLPLPDWVEQPPLPGPTTSAITVVTVKGQQGNGARELRVEASDDRGRTGYYAKPISPLVSAWTFVATGAPLRGQPMPVALPPGREAAQLDFDGSGTWEDSAGSLPLRIRELNLYAWQPARVEVGGVVLALHTHEARLEEPGVALKGALVAPALWPTGPETERLRALFAGRRVLELRLSARPDALVGETSDGSVRFRIQPDHQATLPSP